MLKKCSIIWDQVRIKTPLVHCITNYVTVNDVANIILAGGASPAMVENPSEAGDFAGLASVLYFNLGTLTREQEAAMLEGARAAGEKGVPVVIDPVACGVIARKNQVISQIEELSSLACIKGNGAEIKSLAGIKAEARGVDSLDWGEGLEDACRSLARSKQTVVAATGAVDVVADSQHMALIKNGTELYALITGAGCMAGGVVAACIGANPEQPWLASVTGLLAFNIAGERAALASGHNPGTFRSLLCDQLYGLGGADIAAAARIEWLS
ncbi:MAG: hydroxyethylthiazole kinase [Syntrophomonadaceae bacterium]|nr:hydroxyethylthiazole kinase [Syntrophomonadaceae bacterium]